MTADEYTLLSDNLEKELPSCIEVSPEMQELANRQQDKQNSFSGCFFV
ncbi:hypothetical protein [Eikenella corrodens]|jgi:hypothetical protein|nr:hypothetical protein [Eikenella corrodens]